MTDSELLDKAFPPYGLPEVEHVIRGISADEFEYDAAKQGQERRPMDLE